MKFLHPQNLVITFFLFFAILDFYPLAPFMLTLSYLAFAAMALAYLIAHPEINLIDKSNLGPLLFLGFWFAYNGFTLFWAGDKDLVFDYALYIIRYGITFWAFSILFRAEKLRSRMHLLFGTIFLLYMLTAIYELITWRHLPSSRYSGGTHWVPTGPFYGENIFAAFIILLVPFMVFLPKVINRKWLNIISGLFVILCFVIVTIQGARIAMLSLLTFIAYYFIWHTSIKAKLVSLILVASLVAYVVIQFREPITQFQSLFERQAETVTTDAGTLHMSSLQIRKQLIRETVDLAASSWFMGVGGGNYEYEMRSERQSRTAWITNAHNYLMELLGNHGIIIFFWFIFLYGWWALRLYYLYRREEGSKKYVYLMYLSSLLMFIPTSSLPSSIRWNYHIWIYFAAINAISFIPQDSPGTPVQSTEAL
ncbi:MAG: O-antigen ligase family protein [Candidatus Cloacimonetes bacterium]|nr:O-antigen ligase family protein [Candidatus Cloacimonadota bacterium]